MNQKQKYGGKVFLKRVGVALVNNKFAIVSKNGTHSNDFSQAASEILFVSLAVHTQQIQPGLFGFKNRNHTRLTKY